MELTLEERVAALEKRIKDLEDKLPRKKFVKPTREQVYEHMEKCLAKTVGLVTPDYVDEQTDLFINHYEANGWKVGKAAMKSWEAAISGTWVSNIKKRTFDGKNNFGVTDQQPIRTTGHGKGRFGTV